MKVEVMTLTAGEFVLVLDGSANGHVDIAGDCYWLAASDKPNSRSVAHPIDAGRDFPAPMPVWMRARTGEVEITVTLWSEESA